MAKNSKLYLGEDDKGIVTYEIPWPGPGQSYQTILNADVEQTLSVPNWAYRVLIVVAGGGIVSCGYGDTALTLAKISVWQAELSEQNPILRPLKDPNGNRIETLRFISYTDNTPVNVIFYAKNDADNT